MQLRWYSDGSIRWMRSLLISYLENDDVVPGRAGMLPGHWRPVGRFLSQRLNAGFLVVGHRDHPRLANLASQQSFIENLYFLVDMQYRRHLGLELRVPSLHIVTNLMRPKFSLRQDLMQLGAAHPLQFRVPRRPGLLPQVCGQQTVGP